MRYFRKYTLILLTYFIVCNLSISAAELYYFPANYTPNSGSPDNVTRTAEYPPICTDSSDIYAPRLPGLDAVRGFADRDTCATTSVNGGLRSEPDYVFLVDDTAELSDYLKTQMRQKNSLQTVDGREVIKPSVINFTSNGEQEGFTILTVGEIAFRSSENYARWLSALNQRFDEDEMVAGGQASDGTADDDIWIAYHGSFYNRSMQLLENVSLEKISTYFEKEWEEVSKQLGDAAVDGATAGGSTGGTTPAPSTPTPTPTPTPTRAMNDYMRLCASSTNKVPLPPLWDTTASTNEWVRKGDLEANFTVVGTTTAGISRPEAEVWYYEKTTGPNQGICIALPRMSAGGNVRDNVGALGIICQSKTTGKACFWDNVVRPTPEVSSGEPDTLARRNGDTKITDAAARRLDPVNMRDGYNLNENCTTCHRGENVFLIQENSMLDFDHSSSMPSNQTSHNANRYTPISGTPSSRVWANPVLSSANQRNLGSCTACHTLPAVSKGYCETVLGGVIGRSMPPDNPSTPANESTDFVTRVPTPPALQTLANQCCAVGVNLKGKATTGRCLTP